MAKTLTRILEVNTVTEVARDIYGNTWPLKRVKGVKIDASEYMEVLIDKAMEVGWQQSGGLSIAMCNKEVSARLEPAPILMQKMILTTTEEKISRWQTKLKFSATEPRKPKLDEDDDF